MIEKELDGQMSLFGRDTWFRKTYQEPLVPTKVRTSDASSKKRRVSFKKMPLFLDLMGSRNGNMPDVFWETDGASLGEYMMPSFGEFLREENGFVCWQTSTDTRQEIYYLNASEKPGVPIHSQLSQILERYPDQKYNLSQKACQGILRRAEKRGKQLPPMLEQALMRQAQ